MPVIYHPDAERELAESAQYYEERMPQLGLRFLNAVDDAVRSLAKSPRQWRVIESDVRVCVIPQFPFAIYFRSLPDMIRILAVKHHSRNSDAWKSRLAD